MASISNPADELEFDLSLRIQSAAAFFAVPARSSAPTPARQSASDRQLSSHMMR
jgi:hypothetical protein